MGSLRFFVGDQWHVRNFSKGGEVFKTLKYNPFSLTHTHVDTVTEYKLYYIIHRIVTIIATLFHVLDRDYEQ